MWSITGPAWGRVLQPQRGNPPGFTCYLVAHAGARVGAVVMTNSNNGGPLYREIVQAVARVYAWEGH